MCPLHFPKSGWDSHLAVAWVASPASHWDHGETIRHLYVSILGLLLDNRCKRERDTSSWSSWTIPSSHGAGAALANLFSLRSGRPVPGPGTEPGSHADLAVNSMSRTSRTCSRNQFPSWKLHMTVYDRRDLDTLKGPGPLVVARRTERQVLPLYGEIFGAAPRALSLVRAPVYAPGASDGAGLSQHSSCPSSKGHGTQVKFKVCMSLPQPALPW